MHILIVEDEAVAARRLERMLIDILRSSAPVITIKNSIENARTAIQSTPPDLLFLDLNLNGKSGFDLLAEMVAEPFPTIIVSANAEQAITAFEYGVLDFVAKPFDVERLEKAVARLSSSRRMINEELKYLSVKNHGSIKLIPIVDICYCKGADDYVELYLQNGTMELLSKSMEYLTQTLPVNFIRIHKSYIVDSARARTIYVQSGGKYELELLNGTKLPLSRSSYQEIKQNLALKPTR